jgi:hypothetical protein
VFKNTLSLLAGKRIDRGCYLLKRIYRDTNVRTQVIDWRGEIVLCKLLNLADEIGELLGRAADRN